jgi:hypothetical protein
MILRLVNLLVLLFFSLNFYSQGSFQQNFYSLSELGPTIGNMYYLGDLNPSKQFYRQNLGVGLMYRYNVNARLTYRFNLLAGSVEAYDSDSKNEILKNRNLKQIQIFSQTLS